MRRTLWIPCFASIFVAVALSAGEFASGGPEIGERIALHAHPSSALRLKSATLERIGPDAVRLRMVFPFHADITQQTTKYEIDIASRTYRFTILNEERSNLRPKSEELGSGIECSRFLVRVWSEDPPGIDLAKTAASLGWSYDWAAHDATPRRSGHSCWAVPETPTPLLTHWYTNICYGTPAFDGTYFVQKSVTGAYYNYDFLDDDLITNVRHDIVINAAAPGLSWHEALVEHWGEAAFLLDGYQSYSTQSWDCTGSGGVIPREVWFDDWLSDWCGGDGEVCPNSPLIVDFEGADFQLTSIEEGTKFDISANGNLVRVSWTRPLDDVAFLFRDLDGNGLANHGAELFGDATILTDGRRAANGFDALRHYDANWDSMIDSADPVWPELSLWVDADHDGICRREEVTFASARLSSISLNHKESNRRDRHGNVLRYHSTAVAAARVVKVYDVYLAVDRTPPVN